LGDRPHQDLIIKGKTVQVKSEVKKKILIFSPHPDDDVISMGGTLNRLAEQGHEVHVAYMTPGSNAVHDYDAKKYLHFMESFTKYKMENSKG
jgi:glucosamine-6-phosphate deaminase